MDHSKASSGERNEAPGVKYTLDLAGGRLVTASEAEGKRAAYGAAHGKVNRARLEEAPAHIE